MVTSTFLPSSLDSYNSLGIPQGPQTQLVPNLKPFPFTPYFIPPASPLELNLSLLMTPPQISYL